MDAGNRPALPSGVPPGVAEQFHYNELLDYGGQCQFYILPPGGEFNLTLQNGTTTTFKPDEMIIYALNCNLTSEDYINLWSKIDYRFNRVPFRISLTPLMVVITICTVAAWIIMGVLASLRRHTRPWFHIVVLVYACTMITVLYGFLHHFSRIEHMYGHESTDSFIQYFYGTKRAVAIFNVLLGFMFCECHVIFTIYTGATRKIWILCGCLAFFVFENSWWVAGIKCGTVYDIMTRKVNWKIRVYFYLEVLSHLLFFLAYSYRLLSMWKYSFYKNNRALAILCLTSGMIPFIAMLITAIVKGCFPWSLPLSIVTRALSLLLVWDWHTQTLKTKDQLEKDDALGRLITEIRVKDEFKSKLGADGEGHGAFVSDSFAARIIEKILHPRSIVSSISIWGVGTHDSDEQESSRAETDTDNDNQNARKPHNQAAQPKDAIQHHPVAKHTVKVNSGGGNALQPRFDKSHSQTSLNNRSRNKVTGSSLSRATTLSSTAHSSQVRLSHSGGPNNVDTSLSSETGTNYGTTTDPSDQSRNTRPTTPSNASSRPEPSQSIEPPPMPPPLHDSPTGSDAPPGFIPHPGFRSGDYNNEKRT